MSYVPSSPNSSDDEDCSIVFRDSTRGKWKSENTTRETHATTVITEPDLQESGAYSPDFQMLITLLGNTVHSILITGFSVPICTAEGIAGEDGGDGWQLMALSHLYQLAGRNPKKFYSMLSQLVSVGVSITTTITQSSHCHHHNHNHPPSPSPLSSPSPSPSS